jgi:hypothetical protein
LLQAFFFVFVSTTINEFYVGFDGGNKKKERIEDDGKMIPLMIWDYHKKIYLFHKINFKMLITSHIRVY